jgi:hypothetical protein
MQIHYYSKFPYWGSYYAMLMVPKLIRDWGFDIAKKQSDRIWSKEDINKNMKPNGTAEVEFRTENLFP